MLHAADHSNSTAETRAATKPQLAESVAAQARSFMPAALVSVILLLLILMYGEAFGYTPALAVLSLTVLIASLVALFRVDQRTFFVALQFAAMLVPVAISNAYIEFGAYISEQGVSGRASGATTRLSIFIIFLFCGVQWVTRRLTSARLVLPDRTRLDKFVAWSRIAHIIALVACLAVLAIYGIPLLTGEDRFVYWAGLPELFDRLPFFLAMVSATTTTVMVLRRHVDALSLSLILGSALALILFSEKFTGLFNMLVVVASVGYTAHLTHNGTVVRLGKMLSGSVIALVLLLVAAAYGYMTFYNYDASNVFEKLMDRALALQGHVWFGVDRLVSETGPSGDLSGLVPNDQRPERGGWAMLMYAVAPPSFVAAMLEQGLRFTMGGQALFAYVFGFPLGALLQFAAGALSGLTVAYLFRAVSRLDFTAIMMALFGVRIATNAFLVGDFSDLWKPIALVYWVWLLLDLARHAVERTRNGDTIRSHDTSKLTATRTASESRVPRGSSLRDQSW